MDNNENNVKTISPEEIGQAVGATVDSHNIAQTPPAQSTVQTAPTVQIPVQQIIIPPVQSTSEEINIGEGKKEKNIFIILIAALVILILIAIIGVFVLPNMNQKETEPTEEKTPSWEEIDIDDRIQEAFNNTRVATFGVDKTLYSSKKLSVSEMSDEYKGLIASNIFALRANTGNTPNQYIVSENNVKEAYEEIFGEGAYTSGQKIYDICIQDYTYDADKKQYIGTNNGCGGTSAILATEEIIKAEMKENVLRITTVVIFAAMDNLYKDYTDAESETKPLGKIEDLIGKDNVTTDDYTTNEKIIEYAKTNAKKLEQYTYSFEVIDKNKYKYLGFERTNE